MGSYGDRWLQCDCGRWGKRYWPIASNVAPLWDVDGIGLLCDLCMVGAYPQLTLRWFRDKFPMEVAELIESLSYPEWARMPR